MGRGCSFVRAVERLGTLCSPGSRSVHVQFTKGRTELDDMNTTPDAQTLHTLARIVAARTRARPAAARASPYSGPPESSSDLSAASSRSVASNLARLLTHPAGSRLGAGAAVQLQRGASKRSCNITDREGWLQLMLLWAAQLLKLTCVLLFVLLHALTRSLTRTRVVRDC